MSVIEEANREIYTVKVNGIQFEMKDREPTAFRILEIAKLLEAIPGEPSDYILQGDKGEYTPDMHVNLAEDNIFITIPHTPTPVA